MVFRLRAGVLLLLLLLSSSRLQLCIVHSTGERHQHDYYKAANMSVRMENVAARKINYKMMVSTHTYIYMYILYICIHVRFASEHTHMCVYYSHLFSVFLYPILFSLATDRRPSDDGGCAVRVQLAAYFAQLRRARERVLTWLLWTPRRVRDFIYLSLSFCLSPLRYLNFSHLYFFSPRQSLVFVSKYVSKKILTLSSSFKS